MQAYGKSSEDTLSSHLRGSVVYVPDSLKASAGATRVHRIRREIFGAELEIVHQGSRHADYRIRVEIGFPHPPLQTFPLTFSQAKSISSTSNGLLKITPPKTVFLEQRPWDAF